MPRVKGVNYSKDERRGLILRAGLVTFCRMGYDGTNIDDIARESKCSHGLIYYYFRNKEEIFRELVKMAAENTQAVAGLIRQDEHSSPAEKLRHITEQLFATIGKDENVFYYFQFATMLKLLKKDLSYLNIEQPRYLPYETMREIVAEGQRAGVFLPGDTDAYVNLYLGILQGLSTRKEFSENSGIPFVMPDADMIMRLFVRQE